MIPLLAYVDPQMGSFFFQLLIGGLIGGMMMFKQWWRLLKGRFNPRALKTPADSV